MKRQFHILSTCLSYYTRLPFPSYTQHLSQTLRYYPFVGLVFGFFIWLIWWLLIQASVPSLLIPLCLLLLGVVLTGGLHEDGLADTFDGLGVHDSSPQKILNVMRESQIGVFGSIALWASLSARYLLYLLFIEQTPESAGVFFF
ncbi:MAG: adenosylcobinamide-GDP ribazoletransferase [Cytophagales bacterium]|nr:adenosylcobinamide-GDP ribazoletransferase [Cytophagales bacterium]